MNSIFYSPAFYAHCISGFLLVFAIFILYNYFAKVKKSKPYDIIAMILSFSLVFGIHGISHLGLELRYGVNQAKYIP
jgi:hypothetical protein